MTANSSLEAAGLHETAERFADEEKGLMVVAGLDSGAMSSSARALTRYVSERTGRIPSFIDSGQAVQVQKAAEDGATLILIDGRLNADTIVQAVEAAAPGALVVLTISSSDRPYVQLLDLLQSAENWEIRPKFDAALYAVVQPAVQQAGEKAVEADVFVPSFLRRGARPGM